MKERKGGGENIENAFQLFIIYDVMAPKQGGMILKPSTHFYFYCVDSSVCRKLYFAYIVKQVIIIKNSFKMFEKLKGNF